METDKKTVARKRQKDSRTVSEPSDTTTVHLVCHGCSHLEQLVDGEGVAALLAREHEVTTGHTVEYEEVGQ